MAKSMERQMGTRTARVFVEQRNSNEQRELTYQMKRHNVPQGEERYFGKLVEVAPNRFLSFVLTGTPLSWRLETDGKEYFGVDAARDAAIERFRPNQVWWMARQWKENPEVDERVVR